MFCRFFLLEISHLLRNRLIGKLYLVTPGYGQVEYNKLTEGFLVPEPTEKHGHLGVIPALDQLRLELLDDGVGKVDQAHAADHNSDVPDLLHGLQWEAVQEVCHEPLEDPNLIRDTQFRHPGVQSGKFLPKEQPEQPAVDRCQRKAVFEEAQQQVLLAQREVHSQPERVRFAVAAQHQVPHYEVDALGVTDSREVQRETLQAGLELLATRLRLEQGLLGEGPVQVFLYLPEAIVSQLAVELVFLLFIEIEPTAKNEQLPFGRHNFVAQSP